jgi:hypothetical protein
VQRGGIEILSARAELVRELYRLGAHPLLLGLTELSEGLFVVVNQQ